MRRLYHQKKGRATEGWKLLIRQQVGHQKIKTANILKIVYYFIIVNDESE